MFTLLAIDDKGNILGKLVKSSGYWRGIIGNQAITARNKICAFNAFNDILGKANIKKFVSLTEDITLLGTVII